MKLKRGDKIVITKLDPSDAWDMFRKDIIGRVAIFERYSSNDLMWIKIKNFRNVKEEDLLVLTKTCIKRATKAELLLDQY